MAILLLALVWRLLGITTTDVWRDEATTLLLARLPWWDVLTVLPWFQDTPPLVFILFKLWSSLSSAEWWLRLLPVVFGTATVGVLMRVAARAHPPSYWSVGLLAAFSHVPAHYSQEIRIYSLLGLLSALCFWAVERTVTSPRPLRWICLISTLSAAAGHCHAVGLFVLPMTLVWLAVRAPRGRRWRLLDVRAMLLWLALVSPMIAFAWSWSAAHAQAGTWWVPAMSPSRAKELAARFFGLQVVGQWSAGIGAQWGVWTGFVLERLLMAGPVVLVAAGLLDSKTRRLVGGLGPAAGTYVGLMLLSSALGVPNILDRTLLPAWLPIVLGLGIGGTAGTSVRRLAAGGTTVLLALLYAVTWAWLVYAGPARRPASVEAFAWMRRELEPNDIIFTVPIWYEDQVVYKLGDLISADQLVNELAICYRASPPVHLLTKCVPCPDWRERLEAAIRDRRQRVGDDYSIWMIRLGWASEIATDSTPEGVIAREHRLDSRVRGAGPYSLTVGRYVPRGRAATTTPATRATGPSASLPSPLPK